jgi:hypothetical protein
MKTDHEIIMSHMEEVSDYRITITRRLINEKFKKIDDDTYEWAGLRMNYEGCEAYIHWMLTEYGESLFPDLNTDDTTTPPVWMRVPLITKI